MAAGNETKPKYSPIIRAIAEAEQGTTGEIRVHLSRKLIENDPYRRAQKLFHRFGMSRTTHRNGVLIYVNLRRHKFAIIGDEGIHKTVGQKYWEELAQAMADDLKKTPESEQAIALAVRTLGATLQRFFPLEQEPSSDELDNTVSEDP